MSENTAAWDAGRPCLHCQTKFQPKRPQSKDQKFCSTNCRKNYFRYGARDSVRAAVRADLQREIDGLKRRVAWLEAAVGKISARKAPKILDTNSAEVVTLQQ